CKEKSQQASQQRNKDAFSQQLPHEPTAAGANCKPDRHFTRSSSRLRELKVGYIRARDQQQKPNGSKEQLQAPLQLTAGSGDVQIVGKTRNERLIRKPRRIHFRQFQMKRVKLLFSNPGRHARRETHYWKDAL